MELLIVISVVALLVVILLPVLENAREAARRAVCASNQRQIGRGLHMYAMDSKDVLPEHGTNKEAFRLFSPGQVDTSTDIFWGYRGLGRLLAGLSNGHGPEGGGYLDSLDVMLCPSFDNYRTGNMSNRFDPDWIRDESFEQRDLRKWMWSGSSYALNIRGNGRGHHNTYPKWRDGVPAGEGPRLVYGPLWDEDTGDALPRKKAAAKAGRQAKLERAQREGFIAMADAYNTSSGYYAEGLTEGHYAHPRGDGVPAGANLLFFDGSVSWVKNGNPAEWATNSSNNSTGSLLWNYNRQSF